VKRALLVAATATALLTAACGGGGDSDRKSDSVSVRTVDVDMVDIAFEPTVLTATAGEQVRFVFRNRGSAVHDAFIGDRGSQDGHEREMRQAEQGNHGGGHQDDGTDEDALTLDPGKKGELVHTFDGSGTVEIGCHQPGHYAAGMKITVTVT